MKIAHLLSTFRLTSGGPVRAVIDLSAALAAAGHDVTIFTWDDTDIPWVGRLSEPTPNVQPPASRAPRQPRVHLIPPPALPGQFLSPAQLRALRAPLADHDVLHLHGVWEPVNMQAAAIARRLSLPYIISSRGMLDTWAFNQKRLKKQLYLALAGRRMLTGAARIHLTAEGELNESRPRLPDGRGVIIPNLIDLAPYQNLPGPDLARRKFNLPESGPPVVLFLGRLHKIKALDMLIRAAGLARRGGTDLRLVLAGPDPDGYAQDLTHIAQEAGVADRLTLTGMVKGDAKLSLLQAADLFTLPSHHENFGFVLIEAMACGTPVLASRGVLIWPDIEHSGAGFVADVDEQDFARTLIQALAAPGMLKEMGRTAREWVAREFEVSGVVEQFTHLYERVQANRP